MQSKRVDIQIFEGVDEIVELGVVSDETGVAIDLTGYSAIAVVKLYSTHPDSVFTFSGAEISLSSSGVVSLVIANDKLTSTRGRRRLYYDLLLTSPDEKKSLPFLGLIEIMPSASSHP